MRRPLGRRVKEPPEVETIGKGAILWMQGWCAYSLMVKGQLEPVALEVLPRERAVVVVAGNALLKVELAFAVR
ncbi:hypothetical protein Dda_7920 [Drechslerella dactyloides]|uniref:Uncharacterized protein n=1 Tax=Drechslerella dactyloides TaxID=74499 RepID=A0AAD6NF26_DREDA|nr:hypothetical protein Dda_7920 [Drechslerella dactyloides]